jgi:hypothetical protein
VSEGSGAEQLLQIAMVYKYDNVLKSPHPPFEKRGARGDFI